MTEPSADSIPSELADAFGRAVFDFFDWSPALPELEVAINRRPFPMTAVADLVEGFRDPLPSPVVDRLFSYMDARHQSLKERLAADPCYSTGAHCLRQLIESRKVEWKRLEELRRNR